MDRVFQDAGLMRAFRAGAVRSRLSVFAWRSTSCRVYLTRDLWVMCWARSISRIEAAPTLRAGRPGQRAR